MEVSPGQRSLVPATGRRAEQLLALTLLGICLAAFAALWYRLGYHYLWKDEAWSVQTALLPLDQIIAVQGERPFDHPPLHFLLLGLWLPLGGTSELSARFPSLLFGVLTVATQAALGRALLGRAGAVLASLFVAVSPFAVYYGQEARMYTQVSFLAILGAYGLWRHHRRGERRWLMAGAAALGLGLLTHLFFAFLVAALALALLGAGIASRRDVRPLVTALAFAGVPFLIWLAFSSGTQTSVAAAAGGDNSTPFVQLVMSTLSSFAVGLLDENASAPWAVIVSGLLLVTGITILLPRLRGGDPGRDQALLLVAWLLIPAALAALVPWSVRPRYLTVVYPAFVLVATAALLWLRTRRPVPLGVAVAILAAFSVGRVSDLYATQRDLKSGFAEAAAEVNRQVVPGDVVLLAGPGAQPLLDYYYRGAVPSHLVTTDSPAWDRQEVAASLTRLLARHPRAWLLLRNFQPQEEYVRGWLADHAFELSFDYYDDTVLASYVMADELPDLSRLGAISFGGKVQLDAFRVGLRQDGDRRMVTHRTDWRQLEPGGGLAVSSRLVDSEGRLWADYDWWLPLEGPAGTTLRQNKALLLPPDAPAGTYRLELVVYRRSDLQSLPAARGDVTQAAAQLAFIQIGR